MASRHCPNCDAAAPGHYCPDCGQKQLDRRVTLRYVLSDFADDQFGLNAKFTHTFKTLFLHPGRLTSDYFAGRVQRYNAPFRLYLLASVLFFLTAGYVFRQQAHDISRSITSVGDSASIMVGAGGNDQFIGVRSRRFPTDNWLRDADVNFGNDRINRAARKRLQELSQLGQEEGTVRLVSSMFDEVPKVMFILLPLYAFVLYAFYFRQRRYFVEHFVFLLHAHAFTFLAMTVLLMPFDWADLLVFLWILTYLVVAQRRFYQQSYGVVLVKTLFLSILYISALTVGVLASLALALLTA